MAVPVGTVWVPFSQFEVQELVALLLEDEGCVELLLAVDGSALITGCCELSLIELGVLDWGCDEVVSVSPSLSVSVLL